VFLKNIITKKFFSVFHSAIIVLVILSFFLPIGKVYANFNQDKQDLKFYNVKEFNHIEKPEDPLTVAQSKPINGFGMGSSTNIRLENIEAAYAEMQSMGVRYIREEFPMREIQQSPTSYNFDIYWGFDRMVSSARDHNLEIVALLAYGPSFPYGSDITFLNLWENYVSEVVNRYGDDIDYWEIGNEMNSLNFWKKVRENATTVEVNIYASMLESAYRIIKNSNPNDIVIMGGLINDTDFNGGYSPLSFVQEVQNQSSQKNYDAIGLHTYWGANMPETIKPQLINQDYQNFSLPDYVKNFAENIASMHGTPIPIWVTEVGYDQNWLVELSNLYGETPEKLQSQALARIYTSLLSIPNVETVFWYTYANDSTGQEFSLQPTSKNIYQKLAEALSNTTPQGPFSIIDPSGQSLTNLFDCRFMKTDGQTLSLIWKNDNTMDYVKTTINNLVSNPALVYQLDTGINAPGSELVENLTELDITESPKIVVGNMDSSTRFIIKDNQNISLPDWQATSTSTILLLDTSGSMEEQDVTGYTKIQSAQKAASAILNVILTEKTSISSHIHQVGLISFDDSARTLASISEDLAPIQSAVDNLYASGATAMADGLNMAIDMNSSVGSSYSKMVILLSDGLPNIGLNGSHSIEDSVIIDELLGLARSAKSSGICIHTIGLGLPDQSGGLSDYASMNKDLLMQIASESGCGNYYDANTASELANAFIEIRHSALGKILFNQKGEISQGEELDLGSVPVEQNQEILLFTLNWPGSQLKLSISDPSGITVDETYPNASMNISSSLISLVVAEPQYGDWRIKILGQDVPEGQTNYNMLISSRVKPIIDTPTPNPTQTPAPQTIIPRRTTGSGFLVLVVILIIGGIGWGVYWSTRKKDRKLGTSHQAVLVGYSQNLQGKQIPLSSNFTIGRGSSSNLRLESRQISRLHAQIFNTNGEWYIKDLNSQLGTFVNNKQIGVIKLTPGDRIRIENYVWVFSSHKSK
jgi:Mg-chelatase subunit ChlD